jgi:uncharacterized protein
LSVPRVELCRRSNPFARVCRTLDRARPGLMPTDQLAPTTRGDVVRLGCTEQRVWRWSRPPHEWSDRPDGLCWRCHAQSDFWRITDGLASAYGGSALLTRCEADFDLELEVRAELVSQYDQIGVMVAASDTHWLKAGIEVDSGFRLSAVYTRGESDWSRERWSEPYVHLRAKRHASTVHISVRDAPGWRTYRTLYLEGPVGVGPYSCSPQGAGFDAMASPLLVRG